jgi:hypothetical protein
MVAIMSDQRLARVRERALQEGGSGCHLGRDERPIADYRRAAHAVLHKSIEGYILNIRPDGSTGFEDILAIE